MFAVLILPVLSCSLLLEVWRDGPPFGDEPAWITAGNATFELYASGASLTEWETVYDRLSLGDWGHKNPPVGKFLIGVGVAFAKQGDEPVDYKWNWDLGLASNVRQGNIPPPRLLRAGRAVIAVLACLLLLLVYVAALQLTRRPAVAVVAPVALFMTPVFQFHAIRALTDIPMLTFLASALVCHLRFARYLRWKYFIASLVPLGLAVATKLSAAVFVIALGLHVLALRVRWQHRAAACCALAVLPFAVFVAVNPYLYSDPVGRPVQITRDWSASKKAQQSDPRLADSAVTGAHRGLALTVARSALMPSYTPPFYSRVNMRLVRHLPLLLLLGIATSVLAFGLGFRLRSARRPRDHFFELTTLLVGLFAGLLLAGELGFYAPLFLLGWLGFARAQFGPNRRPGEERDTWSVAVVVWLTAWLLTGAWLPFDWARYYLPVILPTTLLASLGAKTIAAGWRIERLPPADFLAARKLLCSALAITGVLLVLMIATLFTVAITGPIL